MSAVAPSDRPAFTLCPKCFAPWRGNVGQRAQHLIDIHGVPAMTAMTQARESIEHEAPAALTPPSPAAPPTPVAPPPPAEDLQHEVEEGPRMPRPCGKCGEIGHSRKTCPKAFNDLVAAGSGKKGAKTPTKKKNTSAKVKARKTRGARRTRPTTSTSTSAPASIPHDLAAAIAADPLGAVRMACDALELQLKRASALHNAIAQVMPALAGGAE